MGLVKDPKENSEGQARRLEAFGREFRELMGSQELKHIKRVVVLVDDLDRCLPPTVIETLEGIRGQHQRLLRHCSPALGGGPLQQRGEAALYLQLLTRTPGISGVGIVI